MRFLGVTVTHGTQVFTCSLRGGLLVSGTSLLSESLLPSTISNATGLDTGGSGETWLTPPVKENITIPYGEHLVNCWNLKYNGNRILCLGMPIPFNGDA